MRTLIAFVLGAALVTVTWLFAGPRGHPNGIVDPAPQGRPALEGLGERVPDFGWEALAAGEPARFSDLLGQGPVVIAIRDLGCPVVQRYGATLAAMEERYLAEGARFLYVDVTLDAAARTASLERGLGFAGGSAGLQGTRALQVDEVFFQALRPLTTTEVFLVDRRGVLRYRGAIDDQYGVDFARQAPSSRYLDDAMKAVLRGESPAVEATFPPGCYLDAHRPEPVDSDDGSLESTTWTGGVRSLVEENCASCHAAGGTGAFPLDGYQTLVAHREEILQVVTEDRMPPWPANPHYGTWANDRRLSARDKAAFVRWLETGMPEGEPAPEPPSRRRVEVQSALNAAPAPGEGPLPSSVEGDWRNGTPDAVVSMMEPFIVQEVDGIGLETFYLPTDFGEDRWVSRVEILPSAPEAVVQAIALVESPDAPPEERASGLQGFFAAYGPGYDGGVFPAGTAKRLPTGAWLKLHVLYQSPGHPVEDRTRIGFTFADSPPEGELETRAAFATGFEIPSHASYHAVTAEHVFDTPGHIRSFIPHMHLRGSAIRYVLEDPRGNERVLLDIPRYQFQFRLNYEAAEPIPVEAGSILRVIGWYDNSEANLSNPDPSARATFGAGLEDEMLIGYFDFVPSQPAATAVAVPQVPLDDQS